VLKILGVVLASFIVDSILIAIGSTLLKIDFEKPARDLIEDAIETIHSPWDLEQIERKLMARKADLKMQNDKINEAVRKLNNKSL
jgi:hypothetical protein